MAKAAITPALSRAESRSELETCVDVWDAAEISIPDRFRQIAKAHPRQIALSGSIWRPDYAELDRVTDQIGHFLGTTLSNQIGGRVALLLRHDVPQLAAALAVLKAGKMVVVLNPADPPARLRQILEDAEPEAILTDNTHGKLASEIVMAGQTVLHFEKCQATNGTDAPAVSIRPEDAAWLIYTSGTTGKPKGVVQTHRNIVHNVMRISEGMDLQPSDRLLLLNSPGGGLGVSTAWCALLNGATLFPFPIMERGLAGLKTWMLENEISVWVSSTSVFRGFVKTLEVADRFPAVRLVRFGSETATAAEANAVWKHFPEECVLFNSLSASETGNLLQHKFTREDLLEETRLPVGWPARGVEVLLLDEQGREVAAGETGELVIRSRYLSPGYWRNEALTASRFSRVADGLATFRSGDFGKRRADGALIFMDRQDARVKIHGYQVEMSEVEDVLRQQPDIENALVLACPIGDELQLVAHVVPQSGKECTLATMREAVRRRLPPYMVPSYFHFWEQFPLTTNGKIDREKLRETTVPVAVQEVADPPATPTEELLAGIWQKVFNRGAIGRNDDFYDLGGDSLHATVMAAQIHSVLGVEIHLKHLAAHSSLAQLAQFLDGLPRAGQTALPPLAKVSRDRPAPLSFIQERTWKYSRTPEGNLGYTMVGRQRITGPLNVEVLRETMNHLISRHESLRTTFDEVDGKPVQTAHPPGPVALTVLDFSGYADAEHRADRLQREEMRRGFDIRQGPLMRFTLVRMKENDHWLLRLSHHLISDGWSWSIYFREFANVYEAKLNGRAPSFPAQEPLHYIDHAVHERSLLNPEGTAYREMVDWWERTLGGTLRVRPLPSRRRKPFPTAKASSGYVWWGLDPAITARLNVITREQNVTYYTIRLAVFALLLAEHAKGDDLLIGTFATGRNRAETQNMFGDFANLVTLRLKCDQKQTFLQWLKQVDAKISETLRYSAIPYEQLREELKKRNATMPETATIFTVTSHTGALHFGGLEMTWLEWPMEHMPWGLSMTCDKFNDHQRNRLTFDPRAHHPDRVHEMLKRYQQLLDIVSQHSDWTVEQLLEHGRKPSFWDIFKRRRKSEPSF